MKVIVSDLSNITSKSARVPQVITGMLTVGKTAQTKCAYTAVQ